MVQKKNNAGLTSSFAGPKQTLSSLGHTRLNAKNPKNNSKDNTNARDNCVSERKHLPSVPHEAILGLKTMGVVKAAHSYASTIAESGKLSEIAPITPFPLDSFFTELAIAREEESSIRAKLQLPTVLPVRTDKKQPSQRRGSFSIGESDNFDADLCDLLHLPSFRERNNEHVSCAKSMHDEDLSPHGTQYWQDHELPAGQHSMCTTPVVDRRAGVTNHFPHKRQRVGNSRQHLAGSTAEKLKNVVAQKKALERKKLSSMKLQPQLVHRRPPRQQQSDLQAKYYQHITPDMNVMSSGDSDSIISIQSEDDQWFKVLPVQPSGLHDVNKSLWSTTEFRRINGEIINVRNGIGRDTTGEVMKKMHNPSAKTFAVPKKETLETPPSVMTSSGVSKEGKMENEGAGRGMNNAQSSACRGEADELVRTRDQTSMEAAISKDEMYEAALIDDDVNERKVDNGKVCKMINAAYCHDTAGEGSMKMDGETAVVTTSKPETESGLTTVANDAPVVPSVINHIHVEAPTSTQTTLPSEVLNLLREMAEHQHTLAEAAKRQMEVLKRADDKKYDTAKLLGGREPPPLPMPSSSPPIVVMQPPPSSYNPITTQHKENISSNNNSRNLSRLNTALASAVLAVSSRLDNIDSKVMERVTEAERIAQEALKGSKDSIKRIADATLESRFEKVCTYVALLINDVCMSGCHHFPPPRHGVSVKR